MGSNKNFLIRLVNLSPTPRSTINKTNEWGDPGEETGSTERSEGRIASRTGAVKRSLEANSLALERPTGRSCATSRAEWIAAAAHAWGFRDEDGGGESSGGEDDGGGDWRTEPEPCRCGTLGPAPCLRRRRPDRPRPATAGAQEEDAAAEGSPG